LAFARALANMGSVLFMQEYAYGIRNYPPLLINKFYLEDIINTGATAIAVVMLLFSLFTLAINKLQFWVAKRTGLIKK